MVRLCTHVIVAFALAMCSSAAMAQVSRPEISVSIAGMSEYDIDVEALGYDWNKHIYEAGLNVD